MGSRENGDESDGHERSPSPGDDRVDAILTTIAATNGILDAFILVGDITGRATLTAMMAARAALTATAALLTAWKHRQR